MSEKTRFSDMLKQKDIILLDGGLSNELEALGMDLNNSLWSASVLKDNPDVIKQAHLNYLRAGADIIITSSYQASEIGFENVGVTKETAQNLIQKSVYIAFDAVNEFLYERHDKEDRPLVAASIGPYGAAMADGSEYSGNYGISDDELLAFHQDRLMLLDDTNADILACETIPSMQEALILHELLLNAKTPAWISFSCKDGKHANDGTEIEKLAALFTEHPNVLAIGINCTGPQYVTELITRIKTIVPKKVILTYPNSGEVYHADTKTWSGTSTPSDCGNASQDWIKAGAKIIGGCCRMGPDHIKAMKMG